MFFRFDFSATSRRLSARLLLSLSLLLSLLALGLFLGSSAALAASPHHRPPPASAGGCSAAATAILSPTTRVGLPPPSGASSSTAAAVATAYRSASPAHAAHFCCSAACEGPPQPRYLFYIATLPWGGRLPRITEASPARQLSSCCLPLWGVFPPDEQQQALQPKQLRQPLYLQQQQHQREEQLLPQHVTQLLPPLPLASELVGRSPQRQREQGGAGVGWQEQLKLDRRRRGLVAEGGVTAARAAAAETLQDFTALLTKEIKVAVAALRIFPQRLPPLHRALLLLSLRHSKKLIQDRCSRMRIRQRHQQLQALQQQQLQRLLRQKKKKQQEQRREAPHTAQLQLHDELHQQLQIHAEELDLASQQQREGRQEEQLVRQHQQEASGQQQQQKQEHKLLSSGSVSSSRSSREAEEEDAASASQWERLDHGGNLKERERQLLFEKEKQLLQGKENVPNIASVYDDLRALYVELVSQGKAHAAQVRRCTRSREVQQRLTEGVHALRKTVALRSGALLNYRLLSSYIHLHAEQRCSLHEATERGATYVLSCGPLTLSAAGEPYAIALTSEAAAAQFVILLRHARLAPQQPQLLLVGGPNVGKSSLFAALAAANQYVRQSSRLHLREAAAHAQVAGAAKRETATTKTRGGAAGETPSGPSGKTFAAERPSVSAAARDVMAATATASTSTAAAERDAEIKLGEDMGPGGRWDIGDTWRLERRAMAVGRTLAFYKAAASDAENAAPAAQGDMTALRFDAAGDPAARAAEAAATTAVVEPYGFSTQSLVVAKLFERKTRGAISDDASTNLVTAAIPTYRSVGQLIDAPPLLLRQEGEGERNVFEKMPLSVLSHLPCGVLFLFDASGLPRHQLTDRQLQLLREQPPSEALMRRLQQLLDEEQQQEETAEENREGPQERYSPLTAAATSCSLLGKRMADSLLQRECQAGSTGEVNATSECFPNESSNQRGLSAEEVSDSIVTRGASDQGMIKKTKKKKKNKGSCPLNLLQQLTLRNQLRERFPKRPWVDVIAKADLLNEAQLQTAKVQRHARLLLLQLRHMAEQRAAAAAQERLLQQQDEWQRLQQVEQQRINEALCFYTETASKAAKRGAARKAYMDGRGI